jgi:streptogramin lyase
VLTRCCLLVVLAVAHAPAQQLAPAILRTQVPNRGLANGTAFALGARSCLAVQPFGRPFLVWDPAGALDAPREPAAAARWLQQHAGPLAHGVFTPMFAGTRTWGDHTAQVFTLANGGVPLHDAEVALVFGAAGCVGIVNRVPPGLATPPAVPAGTVEPCWYARRADDGVGPDRLVVAERRRSTTADHDVVEFVERAPAREANAFARELTPKPRGGTDAVPQFTVFNFGGFPDQIAADSKGTIWVSDPVQHRLLAVDPQTGAMTPYATGQWTQPDGLCVDDQDRVWTGFYTSGHGLGRFDTATSTLARFAPPYGNAAFAIPTWTTRGTVWVTDHLATRITPFQTATSTFGTPVVLPTSSWPVGGAYEPESGDVFVPLYQTNGLAQIRNNALLAVRPAPVSAGPAFAAAANGKVFFTYWSSGQLGVLDVRTLAFTTFNLVGGGQFGPLDVGPNGHVYVGTRTSGQLVDFDPVTNTAVNYTIPVGSWAMKDGLTVAPDGTVWFTSTGGTVVRVRLQ